ncbi:MAG TPA: DUF3043 domain-containing protein [Pseudonocardiaceae bacterium]|nr:DUF3043 domain-containing protein [Pseudonocardiaceae bacterium]
MKFPRLRSAEASESDESASVEVDAAEEQAETAAEARATTAPKGKPTPKRRDAEGKRRGPLPPPPRTQREASKRSAALRPAMSKDDRNAEKARRRQGMLEGDDRYALPKDRGPVRALIRDEVDAHRHFIGLFMPLVGLVLVITVAFANNPNIAAISAPASFVVLIVMIGEGFIICRRVIKKVHESYPEAPDRGVSIGWYAFQRAMTIRKLRMPKPQVQPGDEVVARRY